MNPVRSWLYAPGHNERLLAKVFDSDADEPLLDLEDAVPPDRKEVARRLVSEAISTRPAWVRINQPMTPICELDLNAVARNAKGLRLPKVERAAEVQWVRDRAPGVDLSCSIETARGVMAAFEIAMSDGVRNLVYGGVDMCLDLGFDATTTESTLYVRSHLVVVSRAARIGPPIDGVWTDLADLGGLRKSAEGARSLGFFGKSALHPRQVEIINQVFTPTDEQVSWARSVMSAFEASGGSATTTESGEFVDLPIAERARRVLEIVGAK